MSGDETEIRLGRGVIVLEPLGDSRALIAVAILGNDGVTHHGEGNRAQPVVRDCRGHSIFICG